MSRYVAAASRILGPNASLVVPTTVTAGTAGSSQNAGLSSGASANSAAPQVAVPVTQVFTGLQASIFGQPIVWLLGLVLFLVAWKLIEEHRGGEAAFSKIRVDGTNVVKTGAMAMLFFIITKYFARAYTVPGASALVLSA